jgi:hypothetical protein
LASPSDLIRNDPAGILIVASGTIPRRNLSALLLQFVRARLPNRTIARPPMPVLVVMPLAASRRHKIRPATMIHPDPVLIGSPRISFLASRTAPLLHKLHAAPRICLAKIPPPIIRSAIERLCRPSRTSRMFRPFVRL